MSMPTPDNQQFSDTTLKGFILKNVDPTSQSPVIQQLNEYLIKRVDTFWEHVVVPLRKAGNFNGNKMNWYFEVYKEGIEARKVIDNPFSFINVTEDQIKEIIKFFQGKTIVQYCELGTSFLSNCYSLLSSWYRDQLVVFRLKKIYHSEDPYDWIVTAEAEERGAMSEKPEIIPGLADILNNIGLIMSKRV